MFGRADLDTRLNAGVAHEKGIAGTFNENVS